MAPPNPRKLTKEQLRFLRLQKKLRRAKTAMDLSVTDSPSSPPYEPERVRKGKAEDPPPAVRRLTKPPPQKVKRTVILTGNTDKKKKKCTKGKYQPDFPDVSSDTTSSSDEGLIVTE